MAIIELEEPTGPRKPTKAAPEGNSWLEKLTNELNVYLAEMQEFNQMEPSEVFLHLSAWSARLTELKIQLSRSDGRASRSFINREIEPFLEEVERQFRFHSRIHATRDMEFRLSGGAP